MLKRITRLRIVMVMATREATIIRVATTKEDSKVGMTAMETVARVATLVKVAIEVQRVTMATAAKEATMTAIETEVDKGRAPEVAAGEFMRMWKWTRRLCWRVEPRMLILWFSICLTSSSYR